MKRDRIKVAIVGGGVAGMTTAHALTQPELGGRYEVTVYQVGWRLGGKGASGRGAADRIEEHGLHLWMGFYDNAFRMIRDVYGELGRDPKTCHIATWRDAFEPEAQVGVADMTPSGAFHPWMAHFPSPPGEPGDPYTGDPNGFTVQNYLVRGAALVRELILSAYRNELTGRFDADTDDRSVGERIEGLLRLGGLATVAAVVEATELLRTVMTGLPMYPEGMVLQLIDALSAVARKPLAGLLQQDDGMRRLWEVVDLVLAILRGTVRFRLAFDRRGFDAIDDYDWREWLHINGASEASLDSAFMRGIYNLALSYTAGDEQRPALAASCALRGSVRMFFGYRGALFYRMNAGMGDIVFAPLYEVLQRRGVKFEFFHRLENVCLSDTTDEDGRRLVDALEFDVQAKVKGGTYEPLVDIRGLPCFPSEPIYSQLVGGKKLQKKNWNAESFWDTHSAGHTRLEVGKDFDMAVLAVGLGAIPHLCSELIEAEPKYKECVTHCKSVASQAFQIWMHADMKQLGWHRGPVTLAGFLPPFETWSDMRRLIPEETWPNAPRSLAYFCSVLPTPDPVPDRSDVDYPARRHAEVVENARRFLDEHIYRLWPDAVDENGEFRWEELVDPDEDSRDEPLEGAARMHSQFVKANIDPSDYYSAALPGTTRYRISPLDDTFSNFTVAGDWTETGLNTGCVEGAAMSGLLAAHAISEYPPLESIIGYNHP